jgi:predicted benzoate:H+ symporter BenE
MAAMKAPTTTREPASASPLDQYAPPTASTPGRSGRATAALIVGIISIPAAIIALAGVILGVVAIVLGATARSDARRRRIAGSGQATAGIVCGIFGALLGLANMPAALIAMS